MFVSVNNRWSMYLEKILCVLLFLMLGGVGVWILPAPSKQASPADFFLADPRRRTTVVTAQHVTHFRPETG